MGKPAEAICKLAIGNYYLRFINRVVDKQQFYFVSIREYLPLCTKSLMTQLISLLKENSSKFLTTTIWSGISHRSKKISSLFLVILTSMLKFSDFPGVTVSFLFRKKQRNDIVFGFYHFSLRNYLKLILHLWFKMSRIFARVNFHMFNLQQEDCFQFFNPKVGWNLHILIIDLPEI